MHSTVANLLTTMYTGNTCFQLWNIFAACQYISRLNSESQLFKTPHALGLGYLKDFWSHMRMLRMELCSSPEALFFQQYSGWPLKPGPFRLWHLISVPGSTFFSVSLGIHELLTLLPSCGSFVGFQPFF